MKYSLWFSLRDLFWITVVVAMAVSWWLDRQRIEAKYEQWRLRAETAIGIKTWKVIPPKP